MQLYLINILFFLIANFFISITIKKYTYEKFFIYVVIYFVIVNFVNLAYLQNIDLFTFQILFSVSILFLYSGLYRSISVKIMVYLYLKKNSVNVDNFYKTEFKEKSFNKRIKILTDNGFLLKKGKDLILSKRGKKYLKMFQIVHSIYKIKSSG
jgi:hypothetical protein|tara:strand:- start:196 stop:654 length:459 start_codon:yes stop_codon:yes gene_type:complete